MSNLIIRNETEADYKIVEKITSLNISQWGRKTQRVDRARRYVNEYFQ